MTDTPRLDAGNERAKVGTKTPWRVDIETMKARVANVEYIRPASIPHMTIAIVLLDNGYALQGMSAPADPENFDEAKGQEFAYEDALKKMWPLEAYVMREAMTGNATVAPDRWVQA